MEEVEQLRKQVSGLQAKYRELKLWRARYQALLADFQAKVDQTSMHREEQTRLWRALHKIAELEPELITAPQIIGYAKRVLERA